MGKSADRNIFFDQGPGFGPMEITLYRRLSSRNLSRRVGGNAFIVRGANVHYILAVFEIGLDGIDRAKWSLYYGDDEKPILESISLDEDFQNMIISEEWQREGYEVVVAK